ncbi:hypothetical protein [Candidatus Manganitrophus noduliformans]|uniref:DUF305 domain-containing protein n=1 Tax=Candidatus Manganitrophus noduliformans TaxID=2606439 RepID=A0A7X6ID67_9BACT|nr:hypothetical protein [Candidatus Manganitrophus noduliformans]NKE73418.1 hypothetical protein [Candidatus Manganitrophus noduliformans]
MKQFLQLALLSILLGGLLAGPAWSEERKASPAQLRRDTQGPSSSQEEDKGSSSQMEVNGMKGGMMDDSMMSMMSRHHDMMGNMLNTMKEMTQVLKEEAKGPDTKARADQILGNIKKMENHHKMMMGMMNRMMPDHGGGTPNK